VSLCSNFIYIEVREDYEKREKKRRLKSLNARGLFILNGGGRRRRRKYSLSIELYVNK